MLDEKAQMHTLEGVVATTLLLMVIIYAIDATSMTPLTSSTSNVHMDTELAVMGQDILNTLDYTEPGYNSNLKNDILNWTGEQYVWNGTKYLENTNDPRNATSLVNNLTGILSATLGRQGIAHKVEISSLFISDNITVSSAPEEWIYAGVPSNNVVIVSRKIVLHNSDVFNPANPIKDIDPSTNLKNIVDIRLFLWRT
ncbi:MAG: hypothetical protein O8C66_08020 [Candidatus Methanoperedens sp.]|nr:hypothetical protein [Candidatus Methanoperedens sp.]MCZ7370442.1 hypothetical protein [Candidatus Methanoperedens sp.]